VELAKRDLHKKSTHSQKSLVKIPGDREELPNDARDVGLAMMAVEKEKKRSADIFERVLLHSQRCAV